MPAPKQHQEGSATVLLVALAAVMALLVGVLVLVGRQQMLHGQAQRAADLAALAAADVHRGLVAGEPCAQAQRMAEANQAQLTSCQLADRSVIVSVRISGVEGRARAGDPLLQQGPP